MAIWHQRLAIAAAASAAPAAAAWHLICPMAQVANSRAARAATSNPSTDHGRTSKDYAWAVAALVSVIDTPCFHPHVSVDAPSPPDSSDPDVDVLPTVEPPPRLLAARFWVLAAGCWLSAAGCPPPACAHKLLHSGLPKMVQNATEAAFGQLVSMPPAWHWMKAWSIRNHKGYTCSRAAKNAVHLPLPTALPRPPARTPAESLRAAWLLASMLAPLLHLVFNAA